MADTVVHLARNQVEYLGSAQRTGALTPNDSTNLTEPYPRAIYVGVTGDVALFARNDDTTGSARVFKAVPAGTTLEVEVKRLMSTGTTATDIIALY